MTDQTIHENGPKGWRKYRTLIFVGAVAVILLVVVLLQVSMSRDDVDSTMAATMTVQPGPLTISVTETGTIQSREQVVIKSEVEGRTTILYLIPEGTQVHKGDLLVELDASSLEDQLVEQQIRVQNAEASYVRARENLEVVKNQATADIKQAELDHRFAIEDLELYEQGEYPKQVKELESRIALSQSELQRAKQEYDGSKQLYDEKYIAQTELEADELSLKKAELDVTLAQEDLSLLKEYTYQRRVDELKAALEQATMALDRVKRKASADVVQAEADLRAKEAEYRQQQDKLAKNEEQIKKTKIYAPQAGLVVYATSTRASWRGNDDPLEEGQEVREREELIFLPATEAMMCKVKIPEAKLEIIKKGLPVRVTVDALPGQVFTGRVSRIAPLPDARAMFMNPDLKVYDTEVHLNNSDGALRTGMSCTVEIVAAHYEQVIFVPVHAVVRVGRQPTVFRKQGEMFNPHPVQLGLDNTRMIRIKEGLAAGDVIMLNPPLKLATVAEPQMQDQLVKDLAVKPDDQGEFQPVVMNDQANNTSKEQSAGSGREGRGEGQPEMSQSDREERRRQFQERMQNMSEEERQQFIQRMRQNREGGRRQRPAENE